jgi:F420-dependent oxidoreductase-like protein
MRPSFGLLFGDFRAPLDRLFEEIVTAAETAEVSGFDSLWVMDHFHQHPPYWKRDDPMLEAYVLLAAVAARTTRADVGVLVSGVMHRNPALLAKMVTTLDVVSGGRAVLGIGASWNEDVFTSYGFGDEEPPISERLDRLEEALQICSAMLHEGRASFDGEFYAVRDALNVPRPLRGRLPILVGGSGEKRLLRLVAQHADISNILGTPDTLPGKLAALDHHCDNLGRDPRDIRRTHTCLLIVADRQSEAERRARAMLESSVIDEESFRGRAIVGTVSAATEQIAERLSLGLDGLMFFGDRLWSRDDVGLLAQAVEPLRGSPAISDSGSDLERA